MYYHWEYHIHVVTSHHIEIELPLSYQSTQYMYLFIYLFIYFTSLKRVARSAFAGFHRGPLNTDTYYRHN